MSYLEKQKELFAIDLDCFISNHTRYSSLDVTRQVSNILKKGGGLMPEDIDTIKGIVEGSQDKKFKKDVNAMIVKFENKIKNRLERDDKFPFKYITSLKLSKEDTEEINKILNK